MLVRRAVFLVHYAAVYVAFYSILQRHVTKLGLHCNCEICHKLPSLTYPHSCVKCLLFHAFVPKYIFCPTAPSALLFLTIPYFSMFI